MKLYYLVHIGGFLAATGALIQVTVGCSNGQLRLVGGVVPYEGRVEICNANSTWGTICDDLWGAEDASVACEQLGYTTSGAVPFGSAVFGPGTGPILLDNVECSGTESSLLYCESSGIGLHDCSHSEDAGVRCLADVPGMVCDYGALRLVGGSSDFDGTVEICINDTWGTVCDDGWDTDDADVVCGQLGYFTSGSSAYGTAYFGPGSGSVFLDEVGCIGVEIALLSCLTDPIGSHDCSHNEDAGVTCVNSSIPTTMNCTYGDLQLVGGGASFEGRLEICIDNEWGTVCDDSWGTNDAMVACAQLGFSPQGAGVYIMAAFGQGNGPILLDDVGCVGTESTLLSCAHGGIENHNCAHTEDAGVRCNIDEAGLVCSHGEVRLVGGSNDMEGRVEVCVSDIWGTVCDDSWSSVDAGIVCVQLGFSFNDAQAFTAGGGTGPIHLDEVNCAGSESTLLQCTSSPIGKNNCGHHQDAGVQCSMGCASGSIRLVDGAVSYEGRVEYCYQASWGTICDDSWDVADAAVVCSQLGYSAEGAVSFGDATFGQGSGLILFDDVECSGTETDITDCPHSGLGVNNCFHYEDAGVRCQASIIGSICTDGEIRLVGGAIENEGRVEICIGDVWGTICDDGWDDANAVVVCRQLNYLVSDYTAYLNAHYGAGTGPIYMDDVNCNGDEENLLSCHSQPIGDHNCGHSEDAGVYCSTTPCMQGAIRLVDGGVIYEGRVEICVNQVWGTVCDDLWEVEDARVVCNQLGYLTEGAVAITEAGFGPGSGSIFLDDVTCSGTESTLLNCSHNGIGSHNCLHNEDAGVRCQVNLVGPVCKYGEVRLAGGTSSLNGRVELCINDEWGTVCDDHWDSVDAGVVCAQLGYSRTNAEGLLIGGGSGPIYLDDVACTGNEISLLACISPPIGTHNCAHHEDAGVQCSPVSSTSVPSIFTTSYTSILSSSAIPSSSAILSSSESVLLVMYSSSSSTPINMTDSQLSFSTGFVVGLSVGLLLTLVLSLAFLVTMILFLWWQRSAKHEITTDTSKTSDGVVHGLEKNAKEVKLRAIEHNASERKTLGDDLNDPSVGCTFSNPGFKMITEV